jgi:hypothetical protein
MKTIFYKKEGRKYIPVREYDDRTKFYNAMPYGNHLVMKYKNGEQRNYDIDPAFAPMIAAGRYCKDAISRVIMRESDLRAARGSTLLTEEQRIAWAALAASFGEETHALQWPSAQEATDAAVKAMQEEADKLLNNQAVRNAYEEFMLICKLTKEPK